MRRFLILAILLLLPLSSAEGAIPIRAMVQIGQVDSAARGLLINEGQIGVFGNHAANGFFQLQNGEPVELTAGVESFITAATVDNSGNYLLVGASATQSTPTPIPTSGILNPDNVGGGIGPTKSDGNLLTYWKLDPSGKLLESNSTLMPGAVIPRSVISDKYGIAIGGIIQSDNGFKSIVLNWGGAPLYLGSTSTQIFSLVRSADGGVIAAGQSGEKLLSKPLRGKSDGFLIKILNNKVTQIQRSSDTAANRAWKSATNNLLLGGYSNGSAVVTKFASNFNPIWTDRYTSSSGAYTAVAGKTSYSAFISTGAIKTLPNWKRKALLLLTHDAKGQILSGSYVNSLRIDGLAASTATGAIVLSGGFLYRA